MYKRPHIPPGDWTICCQRTGFRVLASQTSREWDNLLVWERVWETRQPLDYLRSVPDDQSVPFANPLTEPVFLEPNAVQPGDL